ncbi:MAG TPA: hypothetical protein VGM88_00600 [Kofleriaceae bacterium]|jgi:hypothetical protein
MDNSEKKALMTKELRTARGWILGVGLIEAVLMVIMAYAQMPKGADPDLVAAAMRIVYAVAGAYAGIFFILFLVAFKKPLLACILALVAFWGIELVAGIYTGDMAGALYKGILIKALFTAALVKGIQSAKRGEDLSAELGQVFE